MAQPKVPALIFLSPTTKSLGKKSVSDDPRLTPVKTYHDKAWETQQTVANYKQTMYGFGQDVRIFDKSYNKRFYLLRIKLSLSDLYKIVQLMKLEKFSLGIEEQINICHYIFLKELYSAACLVLM